MKSLVQKIGISAVLFTPAVLAFAAPTSLTQTGNTIYDLIVLAGKIIIALVFVFFIVGLMGYLLGDASKKAESKTAIIYSLLIMFVLFSVWGIIGLLQGTFGVSNTSGGGTVPFPTVTP